MAEKKICVVGGGLAGLVASIHLQRAGIHCHVIEKRTYPFHRVCGEYISNEVLPYLKSLGIDLAELRPSRISQFQLTSVNGNTATLPLDLGGFGVSRYQLDYFLFQKATCLGVEFSLNTECEKITFHDDNFTVQTNKGERSVDLVIGSFGKRSKLDVHLNRSFIQKRSPYLGVKYHIRLNNYPANQIALHNFQNGYCGISCVEDEIVNLCYLTHRKNVKTHGNIRAMEEAVLFQNPYLREIFGTAKFLFDKPETINEISFETKSPVVQHILMAGDAAGMITPLCGNGMAMAIHSAKILSEHILQYCRVGGSSRNQLEKDYSNSWGKLFAKRLWTGRQIQRLFGDVWTSNLAVNLALHAPRIANSLIKRTHGEPF